MAQVWDHVERNEPLIISGGMESWDIDGESWKDENLKKICGSNEISVGVLPKISEFWQVQVRINKGSTTFPRGEYTREKIKFGDFIDRYQQNSKDLMYYAAVPIKLELPELLPLMHEPK